MLALVLIVAGQRLGWLQELRAGLTLVAAPFYFAADIPRRFSDWTDQTFASRARLIRDNESLRAEALLLKAKVQTLAALEAENLRLRELLNSSAILDETVLVAELISVNPDPARHQVVINKGSDDGVFPGQPVIDAEGLTGQVIEVGPSLSRVLLITDITHAIPVQVNRNGVRSIAEGTGRTDELELRHVPATMDIEVGDLLVSSGLGQRFPVGYPVGVVTQVTNDPGKEFAVVKARPSAQLNRSRYLLLVFTQQREVP